MNLSTASQVYESLSPFGSQSWPAPTVLQEKLVISSFFLAPMTLKNAYECGFAAVGSWLGYGESGEVEALAGRGHFQVGSQVGRLAR